MEPSSLSFPDTGTFLLHNAFVPECCLLQQQHEEDDGHEDAGLGKSGGGAGGHGGANSNVPLPSSTPLLRSSSSYPDLDSLVHVDMEVADGVVREICKARPRGGVGDNGGDGFSMASASTSSSSAAISSTSFRRRPIVDAACGIVFPCFVDLHTHIDKSHTCERSRNKYGSLSGADRSTARDAALWDEDDVVRRMEFSLRCAYAHGTSALRTHLINMTPRQVELTWPAFDRVRAAWRGRVELQGVSLVALSFFRDKEAAEALAELVAARNKNEEGEGGGDSPGSAPVVGVLGAAVCCAENGGDPDDEWTTCAKDRDELLDFFFDLASRHGLSADFHADENGNRAATGLRDVARAVLRRRAKVEVERASSPSAASSRTVPFTGTVVCGHCCSLAALDPAELADTLALVKKAGITIVSLPLVNEWTQDRDPRGLRAPRWRGIPPLLEIARHGVAVALASDNVRDQFYSYGDLDAVEVLRQGVRAAHLDTPYGAWPGSVTIVPARAMGLLDKSPEEKKKKKKKDNGGGKRRPSSSTFGAIAVGAPADFVVFRARAFSELLARPQSDRVVVRSGRPIGETVPPYEQLYAEAASVAPPRGFGHAEGYGGRLSPAPSLVVAAAAAAAATANGANGSNARPPPSASAPPPEPRGLEGEGVLTETRQQRAAAAAVCAFATSSSSSSSSREERGSAAAASAAAAPPPGPLASPFKAASTAAAATTASNGHGTGEHSTLLSAALCSSPSFSTSTLVAVGLAGAAAGAALAALALGRGRKG